MIHTIRKSEYYNASFIFRLLKVMTPLFSIAQFCIFIWGTIEVFGKLIANYSISGHLYYKSW